MSRDPVVEVVACGEREIEWARCGACFMPFSTYEACERHERDCLAVRDLILDEKLYAQAIEDGRLDDAAEICERRLW